MASIDDLLAACENNPANVRFVDLVKICESFFGAGRQHGTSHLIFKTPWYGGPRINIQESKGGKAKAYQVRQVLLAVAKLRTQKP